jgi:hypothetical protein
MADISLNTTVLYVTEEITDGTAVDQTAANQAVSVTSDGFQLDPSFATIERNNMTSSIEMPTPRLGIKTSSASLSVEVKANTVAGVKPECDLLLECALGATRANTNTTTTITTTNLTVIPVALVTGYAAGDIVMFKDTNGYHITPLTAASANGTNDDTVTCLVPFAVAPASNTVIEKFTTFYGANSGHPSLTLTAFMEDAYKIQSAGNKVTSLSLEGFEPSSIATFSFGLNGTSYDETASTSSGLTATFDGAEPPTVLSACVYKDGVQFPVSSFGFSLENTISQKLSTCSPNGIIGQKVTKRVVTGSFSPYMATDSTALFDAFNAETKFSLFGYLANPTSTAGQKKEVVAFYLPICKITNMPKADADGLMQYNVEFQAEPDTAGSSIYISFI